jgi:hypothetical protein
MDLRCKATNLNGQCDKTAQYVMVTACPDQHLEETPLCVKHNIQWENWVHQKGHPGLHDLFCDHCRKSVIECDYTLITTVTETWMKKYITELTAQKILDEMKLRFQ